MGGVDKMALKSPIHPKVEHMTTAEMHIFKGMREAGSITLFRCTSCENCGAEIPKPKRFCSIECKEIFEQKQEEENTGEQEDE